MSLPHQAVLAFIDTALAIRKERDEPDTKAALARRLNTTPQQLCNARKGHGGKGSFKLAWIWLTRWEALGYPALELRVRSDSVSVVRVGVLQSPTPEVPA